MSLYGRNLDECGSKIKWESGSPVHEFHRQSLHLSRLSLSPLNFTSDYLDEKHEEYCRFRREFERKLFEKMREDASSRA